MPSYTDFVPHNFHEALYFNHSRNLPPKIICDLDGIIDGLLYIYHSVMGGSFCLLISFLYILLKAAVSLKNVARVHFFVFFALTDNKKSCFQCSIFQIRIFYPVNIAMLEVESHYKEQPKNFANNYQNTQNDTPIRKKGFYVRICVNLRADRFAPPVRAITCTAERSLEVWLPPYCPTAWLLHSAVPWRSPGDRSPPQRAKLWLHYQPRCS